MPPKKTVTYFTISWRVSWDGECLCRFRQIYREAREQLWENGLLISQKKSVNWTKSIKQEHGWDWCRIRKWHSMTNDYATLKWLTCWRIKQRIPRHTQIKGYKLKKNTAQLKKYSTGRPVANKSGQPFSHCKCSSSRVPIRRSLPHRYTQESRSFSAEEGESLSVFSTSTVSSRYYFS